MANPKRPQGEEDVVRLPEAGKGELDDEVLPNRGEPVPQEEAGGDEPDPGAAEGAAETAESLQRNLQNRD